MTAYTYKALRRDGSATTGSLDVANRREALQALDRQGLDPLELREGAAPATMTASRRVPAKVLEAFTRQLASLLAGGIPLSQALHLLAREADAHQGRDRWQAIHDAVVEGSSLAAAMQQQPDVFPRVYVAMVRAGETGGFLDVVLRQIAAFQNRERELRSKVQTALLYPSVLAALAVAVVIFLMVFFIPRFQGIFADFGAALPPLTRGIVGISLWLQHYGLALVLVGAVGVQVVRRWLATPEGHHRWQEWLLRLPILGDLTARFAMTRFCRMLGTLTHAGVPIVNALRVAREAIGNDILADAVDDAIDRVQHGDRLGDSLAGCPQLFPRTAVAMITVAEQSGRLDDELLRLADDTEEELDRRLRAAVALAEPAMLFIMAAVVGTIVIGMVLPIFAIQDYIN